MKKILSIALALALCLTAMMGCFVVSAAANTLAVGTADITVGDATADVVVDITSEGVWAIRFDVKSDVALTAVAIDDANFNAELEGTKVLVQSVANDYANNITAAKITLTFATADLAAGSYAVAIENIDAGNYAEAAVAFDTTAGAIDVAEAVVEPAEPELDAGISISASASITESLGAAYFVKVAELAKYDHYELVITQQRYNGDYNEYSAEPEVIAGADLTAAGSTQKYYRFTGVAMYELGLNIKVQVKCYDADNNYVAYSNEFNQSIADILKALYKSTSKTTTKYLVTDLLNVGAEAQAYFAAKKPSSDLATATAVNDGWDQTYATAEVGALNTVNSTVYADNAPISNALTTNVSLTSSPAVAYLFNKTGIDAANLRMELTYHSNYFNKGSDVTATVVGDDWDVAGNFYRYDFTKTCLYDANKTVTAKIYYNDELVLTNEYSVETYASKTASTSSAYNLMNAIVKFGASSRAYFGTT